MIEVEGTERFRRVLLIVSAIFSMLTLLILMSESRGCPGQRLEIAIWLAFSI